MLSKSNAFLTGLRIIENAPKDHWGSDKSA